MLKFLRKYQMWILVVGGSLLMIAFVAPQAVEMMFGASRNPEWLEVDGETVRMQDFRQSASEFALLDRTLPYVTRGLLPLDQSSSNNETSHWFMLQWEAERAGFSGREADGQQWLDSIATALVADVYRQNNQLQLLTTERLAEERERVLDTINENVNAATGGDPNGPAAFFRALGKARGATRLQNALGSSAKFSPERLRADAARRLNIAEVATLWVPAEKLATEADLSPSEADLEAFFAEYRESDPVTSELGIGYRLPPRIKLEWLTLDRNAIRDAVEIDAVEAAKHHQLNSDRFTGTFSEDREGVNNDLRNIKADDIIKEASQVITGEAKRAALDLPESGDYKDLPEDWAATRPSLDALADLVVSRVQESKGVTIPRPTINVRDANWLQFADVGGLEGIGFANIRVASQNIPFRQAVFSLKELGGSSTLPLQSGLLASEYPATTFDGSRHYFRVLDVRDVSPPDSLDEVREDVIADFASVRAYQRLAERADELRQTVEVDDLDALATQLNEEGSLSDDEAIRARAGLRINRTQGGFTPEMRLPEVRDAIVSAAEMLELGVPADEQDIVGRVVTVNVPSLRGTVVARIDGFMPLTQEDFRRQHLQMRRLAAQAEISEHLSAETGSPFGFERLQARHGYRDLTRDRDEREDEDSSEG